MVRFDALRATIFVTVLAMLGHGRGKSSSRLLGSILDIHAALSSRNVRNWRCLCQLIAPGHLLARWIRQ